MVKKETTLTKEKETIKEVQGIPTISFESKNVSSMTEWNEMNISVSDATAQGALDVFKEVIKNLGLE